MNSDHIFISALFYSRYCCKHCCACSSKSDLQSHVPAAIDPPPICSLSLYFWHCSFSFVKIFSSMFLQSGNSDISLEFVIGFLFIYWLTEKSQTPFLPHWSLMDCSSCICIFSSVWVQLELDLEPGWISGLKLVLWVDFNNWYF